MLSGIGKPTRGEGVVAGDLSYLFSLILHRKEKFREPGTLHVYTCTKFPW